VGEQTVAASCALHRRREEAWKRIRCHFSIILPWPVSILRAITIRYKGAGSDSLPVIFALISARLQEP
jgi:hypothetical protein